MLFKNFIQKSSLQEATIDVDQLHRDMTEGEVNRKKLLKDLTTRVAALNKELNKKSNNVDREIERLVSLLNSNKGKF